MSAARPEVTGRKTHDEAGESSSTRPEIIDRKVGGDDANDRSLTIPQFCELENFSLTYFYKLKRLGLAPDVLNPPGTNLHRITPAARHDWHQKMRELAQEEQARKEAARRSEHHRRLGQLAARSAKHVSRRKRNAG